MPCRALEDSFLGVGEVFRKVVSDEFGGRTVAKKVAKFGGSFGSGAQG